MDSSTYAAIVTSVPETVQRTGNDAVQSMLAAVVDCLTAYTAEDLKRLIALGYSQRYFERTVSALQRQASQQSKYYRQALYSSSLNPAKANHIANKSQAF